MTVTRVCCQVVGRGGMSSVCRAVCISICTKVFWYLVQALTRIDTGHSPLTTSHLLATSEGFEQTDYLCYSPHIVHPHHSSAVQHGIEHGSQGAFQAIPNFTLQHVP
jgi:hypothetical protein